MILKFCDERIRKHAIIMIVLLFLFCLNTFSLNAQQKTTQRVWSDKPAFTSLFENENERGLSSDIYDNLWEGDPVPQLPRVKNPSEQIKRWQQGEGTNYLSEEINALTKGKYPNPVRIFEAEPYPIGNGRIAASVFNGSGRDRYSLNEVSFWSGGRNGGTINNKGDKPYDIKGPDIDSAGFGSYQPIADLIVDFNAPVQKNSFIREICMDEGIVHSSGKRNNITVQSTSFCSYPDQVMVLHYQADKKGGLNATFLFATQRKIDSVVND